MLRVAAFCSAALVLAACGEPPVLAPIDPATPLTPCTWSAVDVVPADGAGPLHRMTPVAVAWTGGATEVAIEVRAAGKDVEGETWVDDGRAVFIPRNPLPADTRVEWSATACRSQRTGSFLTGALLHPMEDLEGTHVGHLFEVDLRRARWSEPAARTDLGGVLLKWHMAPAFLVTMSSVTDDEASFLLAPAIVDDNGGVVQDVTRPVRMMKASLATNPYLALDPVDLAFALGDSAGDAVVTLRGAELLLGLTDNGLDDGRVSAVIDVRGLANGHDPCAMLQSLTGETCQPCDAHDEEGGCFVLEMSDVKGLPAASQRFLDLKAGSPPPVLP